jgi:hypothetical protein
VDEMGGAYFWTEMLRGPDRFRTGVRGVADRSLASRAQDHFLSSPSRIRTRTNSSKGCCAANYTKGDYDAHDGGSELLLLRELLAERPFD